MAQNIKVIKNVSPIKDRILVHSMESGEKLTRGGLIIPDDDGKERGIKPRWCQVYKLGPDVKEEIKVGDWILVEHGRWSRQIAMDDNGTEILVQLVENKAIMLVSEDRPF